jgi:uncharacterized membrane protein
MNWIHRYRCRVFMRSSMFAAPIASMAGALLAAPLIRLVDERTRWSLMGFGPEGARLVVGALASSLLTFIVFAFSIILLAVQVAGGQLSPRIIARIFETRLLKLVLSAFVFSYAYSLAALGRIEDRVQQLPLLVAVLSSLFSIALFIYLIQKVSQSFRPVIVLTRVADDTRKVINALFSSPFSTSEREHATFNSSPVTRTIANSGSSGVVLAFDAVGLMAIARRAGCTIELLPQVGDFLATGEDMFCLHGAGADVVSDGSLHSCVALGSERALENDPAFGFRIIVDIASKALSPAINDPTTGVLAIDQLHHLLHLIGQRQLDSGVVRDSASDIRLVYRTPTWEDFVTLAFTETRLYGATSPQVTRRLQAMLERLLQVVPVERSEALRKEMALLGRTIERSYADQEDRIMSSVSDWQGFGSRAR